MSEAVGTAIFEYFVSVAFTAAMAVTSLEVSPTMADALILAFVASAGGAMAVKVIYVPARRADLATESHLAPD